LLRIQFLDARRVLSSYLTNSLQLLYGWLQAVSVGNKFYYYCLHAIKLAAFRLLLSALLRGMSPRFIRPKEKLIQR
jgi:hypothetical protein